jgi:hypothetical protein
MANINLPILAIWFKIYIGQYRLPSISSILAKTNIGLHWQIVAYIPNISNIGSTLDQYSFAIRGRPHCSKLPSPSCPHPSTFASILSPQCGRHKRMTPLIDKQ